MSSLKIGLVASSPDESKQLIALLQKHVVQIVHHIEPQNISSQHIEEIDLHVWLLCVDDDSWHDEVDQLLDESEIPVYFNEPGTLTKQSHPEYWCSNLLARLYEITGLQPEPLKAAEVNNTKINETKTENTETENAIKNTPQVDIENSVEKQISQQSNHQQANHQSELSQQDSLTQEEVPLANALDELESSAFGLPKDIAAELVSELESISPVLTEELVVNDENKHITEHSEITIEEKEQLVDSFSVDDDLVLDDIDILETDELTLQDEETNQFAEAIADPALMLDDIEPIELEALTLVEEAVTSTTHSEAEFVIDEHFDMGEEKPLENEAADLESDELTLQDDEANQFEEVTADTELMLDDTNSTELEELTLVEEETTNTINSGKAEFVIDDHFDTVEEKPPESEVADEPADNNPKVSEQLTLEALDDEQPITGRATFVIDEGEDELPNHAQQNASPQQNANLQQKTAEEEPASELTLEELSDDQSQPNWLQTSSVVAEEIEPSVTTNEETESLIPVANDFESELTLDLENDELSFELTESDELELTPETPTLATQTDHETSDELSFELTESDELELISETPVLETQLLHSIDDSDVVCVEKVESTLSPESDHQQSNEQQSDEQQNNAQQNNAQQNNNTQRELEEEFHLDSDILQETEIDPKAIQTIARQAVSNVTESAHDATLLNQPNNTTKPNTTKPNQSLQNEPQVSAQEKTEQALAIDAESTVEFDIPMLDETAVDIEFEEKKFQLPTVRYTPCWVIGASLGGPAAVKRFLNCIPADINASMIIAQHIDENFLSVLADILTSNSQFDVVVANGSNDLKPGKIYLAPLKGKIIVLQDGSMLIDHSQKWSPPYSPCINDVIESVSHIYGKLSGAIIFSGMGEDGLQGARKMREAGGLVWAQSVDTCANASMPKSVIDEEQADFVGSPEELAEQLINYLKN